MAVFHPPLVVTSLTAGINLCVCVCVSVCVGLLGSEDQKMPRITSLTPSLSPVIEKVERVRERKREYE